ncbi:MAG: phosphate/phosphite/phosphonate ABC transporter substrate-binding protein [Chloroflexi bacterium]|nr:phosphate/phosphite/phosphonate ABC transporter substrate-binding protein [Chloroflexota bacterium]
MFLRRFAIFLLLLVAVVAIGACNSDDDNDSNDSSSNNASENSQSQDEVVLTGEPVRVGILSKRSAVVVNQQWGALMSAMEQETGRPFELVPLGFDDILSQINQGNLDFAFGNPLAMTQARRLSGIEFLATLSYPDTGAEFGGIILVRSDSGITSLDDLRGKSGACVAFETSAGGCIFQLYHLAQHDIDPFTDFSEFIETGSQDNVVLAVLNNTVDVGFARTGQLETMESDGSLDTSDIDELTILAETQSYPEWAFAALPDTDPDLVQTVQNTLLTMPAGSPAFQAAGVAQFIPAVDYSSIDVLIETLKLPSWDAETAAVQ